LGQNDPNLDQNDPFLVNMIKLKLTKNFNSNFLCS